MTAQTFVVLSALVMILLQPAFPPSALATFQATSKAGGPAAAAVGRKLSQTELLSSNWTGFFTCCLHTLSRPDHLAALAPLFIGRSRMESAAIGALWGRGHDAGQVIFGLIFFLLKDRPHIEVIRTWGHPGGWPHPPSNRCYGNWGSFRSANAMRCFRKW